MNTHRPNSLLLCGTLTALIFSVGNPLSADVKVTSNNRPITKPKFDPRAEQVTFFDGIEQGKIEVQLIPKDEFEGNMLVQNKTEDTITVILPEAIAAKQVLKQFGGGFGGGFPGGGFGGGFPGGGGFGGNQNFGGGFGNFGGGGGFGNPGLGGGLGGGGLGGGLGGPFSIPPEKIVKVPYQSVCLEHGKKEPNPKNVYEPVPVEEYTQDAALQELLKLVATHKVDRKSAQAAAWHLTDNMSWQELAAKRIENVGQRPRPYFHPNELRAAYQIVTTARVMAQKKSQQTGQPAYTPTPGNPRANLRTQLRP